MTIFTAVRHDGPVLVDERRILWVCSDTPTAPARIMMEGGGYVEVRESVDQVLEILADGKAVR